MAGALEGGWAFVWAAYGITALTFIAYSASIAGRLRAERRRHAQEWRKETTGEDN